MNFNRILVTINEEPLNRRHTWDSMTDIERDIVINVSKCSMPSSEFLQALQEECGGKYK